MLVLIGAIGLMVSAPYWLSVIRIHGADLFITPFLAQHQSDISPGQIEQIFNFQPAGTSLSFIWNWLILAGLFWAVFNRNFLIVGIFFVFWWIPREGIWLVSIPAAILSGSGFVFVLLPFFMKIFKTSPETRPPLAPGVLGLILVILILANAFFSINTSISDPEWHINRDQIEALSHLRENIPKGGRVVILGNVGLAEWAPAILQREVLNLEYGLEWQPDELYKVRAINAAIEKNDDEGMIHALGEYCEDSQIYLITIKDENPEALGNSMVHNNSLRLIDSTPALDLYILHMD
jgi:hypothetical protein